MKKWSGHRVLGTSSAVMNGGVVKSIKLDNLKSGVLAAHLYEPVLNPNYQAYSEHCRFIPLPCRVATPEQKGKGEPVQSMFRTML